MAAQQSHTVAVPLQDFKPSPASETRLNRVGGSPGICIFQPQSNQAKKTSLLAGLIRIKGEEKCDSVCIVAESYSVAYQSCGGGKLSLLVTFLATCSTHTRGSCEQNECVTARLWDNNNHIQYKIIHNSPSIIQYCKLTLNMGCNAYPYVRLWCMA